MSKICPNCKYPNDDNANICLNCKTDISPENLANQEKLNWERKQNKTQEQIIDSMKYTISQLVKFEIYWQWFIIIVSILFETNYIICLTFALTVTKGNISGIFITCMFLLIIATPLTGYLFWWLGKIILRWLTDMLRFQYLSTKQFENIIHMEKTQNYRNIS